MTNGNLCETAMDHHSHSNYLHLVCSHILSVITFFTVSCKFPFSFASHGTTHYIRRIGVTIEDLFQTPVVNHSHSSLCISYVRVYISPNHRFKRFPVSHPPSTCLLVQIVHCVGWSRLVVSHYRAVLGAPMFSGL